MATMTGYSVTLRASSSSARSVSVAWEGCAMPHSTRSRIVKEERSTAVSLSSDTLQRKNSSARGHGKQARMEAALPITTTTTTTRMMTTTHLDL